MSQRRISVFPVATADWMKFRPYTHFNAGYDGYYLRLSNRVFQELNDPKRFVRELLTRDQVVELSVVLSSWFEDFANEIGIWSTFTQKNYELYGYYLPFFELADYNEEEIRTEDLMYLIWHYCNKAASKLIAPDSPGLREIASDLMALFDQALDDAPGTDYYDLAFMTVMPDTYFFEVKFKLHWIAFKNYLLGPEMQRQMNEEALKVVDSEAEMREMRLDSAKIVYAIQDEFHYNMHASFLGFSMPEWLAAIAVCPEFLRDDIRRLSQWIVGEFVYEGKEGTCYLFRHLHTKNLFKVAKASVSDEDMNAGDLVFTSLVKWGEHYWVSGMLSNFGDVASGKKKKFKEPNIENISFYAWSKEDQKKMRDMNRDLHTFHLYFYGEPLVFFKNEQAMNEALEHQREYFNQLSLSGKSPRKPDAKHPAPGQPFVTALEGLNLNKAIGLYFEPGVGTMTSPLLPSIAYRLQQSDLSPAHAQELFFSLFTKCSPGIIYYLLGKYGARNLRFPVNTSVPIMPHLEFLMRYYNPQAFREPRPNNVMVQED